MPFFHCLILQNSIYSITSAFSSWNALFPLSHANHLGAEMANPHQMEWKEQKILWSPAWEKKNQRQILPPTRYYSIAAKPWISVQGSLKEKRCIQPTGVWIYNTNEAMPLRIRQNLVSLLNIILSPAKAVSRYNQSTWCTRHNSKQNHHLAASHRQTDARRLRSLSLVQYIRLQFGTSGFWYKGSRHSFARWTFDWR